MAAEPGLTLTIYTAEPGSPSEDALRLLASRAASQEADVDARTLSAERLSVPLGEVGGTAPWSTRDKDRNRLLGDGWWPEPGHG